LPDDFTPEERVNIAVYEHVNRSVVNITTRSVRNEGFFFGDVASEGEGSGVVIDHQGRILTNFHVVDEAREVQVTLFNSKTYDAKTVGQDPASDVAVVQIDAPPGDLYPVTFGDSTRLRVGQKVFAIGNPFGLERTLTTGIISSLNRSLPSRSQNRTIKQIIQIDAAINPGNSGGPLLDTHGRMIGINTAIASRTGESAGVGFAIPVNTVGRVLPQIIQRGHVVRPDVGITRVYQTDRGLLLATLTQGGAAQRAGLRGPKVVRRTKRQGPFVYEYQTVDRSAADLIVAVDGNKILTADDFLSAIDSKQQLKGLILAQNERWRRGLGMQVEREGPRKGKDSGERESNTSYQLVGEVTASPRLRRVAGVRGWPGLIGTETLPRLLREAAVTNLRQWAQA
jgi:S1-C subfamily serine protease